MKRVGVSENNIGITITEVGYLAISIFKLRALKENVDITNTPNTEWYMVMCGDEYVGCGGIMYGTDSAKLKGIYIKPTFRGRGYGSVLTKRIIDDALWRVKKLNVLSSKPEFYIKMGWQIVNTKNGVTKLTYLDSKTAS